jgi:glycosyltransferase involved in cell wall biosynthesis
VSDPVDFFPRLSVVIPTWNRAALLPAAIASVRAQAHPALELIVVDDGSTDDTAAVLRVRNDVDVVLRRSNGGPAAARNAGIRQARGEWIGFLDSDDLWTPDALRLHAQAVAEKGVQPIVLGDARFTAVDGSEADPSWIPAVEPPSSGVSAERYRYLRQFHLGSALFVRSVFDRIGMLDESLWFHEDREFFQRAELAAVSMLRHDGIVQVRRIHDHNMTRDTERVMATTPRFLKRALDLRRRKNDE